MGTRLRDGRDGAEVDGEVHPLARRGLQAVAEDVADALGWACRPPSARPACPSGGRGRTGSAPRPAPRSARPTATPPPAACRPPGPRSRDRRRPRGHPGERVALGLQPPDLGRRASPGRRPSALSRRAASSGGTSGGKFTGRFCSSPPGNAHFVLWRMPYSAVVVGHRDRLVLVVVAAGAAERQAHQRPTDGLDGVGEVEVLVVRAGVVPVALADGEEAGRGHAAGVLLRAAPRGRGGRRRAARGGTGRTACRR